MNELFPIEGFTKGQTVLVGGQTAVIVGFSTDLKRAEVKFPRGAETYLRWVDMDEMQALHRDAGEPAGMTGHAPTGSDDVVADARGDLAGMTGRAPTGSGDLPPSALPQREQNKGSDGAGSDDVIADARGDLAGMTCHAPTGSDDLRGMIAKLQADLLLLQEQVNDHEDYIDMQVAESFDAAERENEALLTRTEVAVLQVNSARVGGKYPLNFDDELSDVDEYKHRIPQGWEFVSSQVVSQVLSDDILFYTYLTIKRDVPIFEWDGGVTDGVQAVSEDTQRIPVELLQAED